MRGEREAENLSDLAVRIDSNTGYFKNIDAVRLAEYPQLAGTTYLDHAGTTLYAKSLVDSFSNDLTQSLFGNPHSGSASSQLTSRRIDDVRLEVLRFFNASKDEYDVVFTANATAAAKLVAEAFRDHQAGFHYAYHVDSHTSLVGVREVAVESICFEEEVELDRWLSSSGSRRCAILVAWPGQSNMTGSRHEMKWCEKVNNLRSRSESPSYSFLDAAALSSTAPIDLSSHSGAPDFVAVSFYKIFGFPDLGALLVRKETGQMFTRRKYFGGGTVDSVVARGGIWHAKKQTSLHDQLEDGTLPFHNIVALEHAFKIHNRIYGSMANISRHTGYLASKLRTELGALRHPNGQQLCRIYGPPTMSSPSGPVVAFNVIDHAAQYLSCSEFEKLCIVQGFQVRIGGLCNPGGTANSLGITSEDLRRNHAQGFRCGNDNDILNGRPTGTIRASLGAMSSLADIELFVRFLKDYFTSTQSGSSTVVPKGLTQPPPPRFVIESLAVYPIKSCAAFKIPPDISWEVGPKGLKWDREWCLVHEGTNAALSQKRHPQMAMLHTYLDVPTRTLRIMHDIHGSGYQQLEISLDELPTRQETTKHRTEAISRTSDVCGEGVDVMHYTRPGISDFFTKALGVPCTLARFPMGDMSRQVRIRQPHGHPGCIKTNARSIGLANESPILLVSRSSVNRLNEQIKEHGGASKAVSANSFRPNIVISEELSGSQSESPYLEDEWAEIQVGERTRFEVLGPCQRCQMVCIDQTNSTRQREPFSTLAKTRRREGKVWFGVHIGLLGCLSDRNCEEQKGSVRVGDIIQGNF